MFPKSLLLGVAYVLMALMVSVAHAADPPVTLLGRTREYVQDHYQPLGRVRISVYRQGPVVDGLSDQDGKFSLEVPPGVPFKVLFVGLDDYLPELQSLAAEPSTTQAVSVCLLTTPEAKKQGIDPYRHVRAIIDQLDAQGVKEDDNMMQLLRLLLQRLG